MWEVLCGTLELVRDLGLEDLGRKRFHLRNNPDFKAEGFADLSGRQLFRDAFAALRDPWRLAMIDVETDYAIPDMPRESDIALVAWAEGLTALIRGRPAKGEILGPADATFGDKSLRRLLHPEPLGAVVPPPWAEHLEIAGADLETHDAMFAVPELITIGADGYEGEFDGDLGILTSWTAYIDDRVATRFRLDAYGPLWRHDQLGDLAP